MPNVTVTITNSSTQPNSTQWDLSGGATKGTEFDLNESNAQDIYWKPDGTKFYIIGATGDNVYEYTTSTDFVLSGSTLNHTLDISGNSTVPTGIDFKDDGSLFIISDLANDKVLKWTLSTNWLLSSASYASGSSAWGTGSYTVEFPRTGDSNYGKIFWIIYQSGADYIMAEHSMSTAWNVTTVSTTPLQTVNLGTKKFSNFGFNEDGTRFWGGNENSGVVYTYDLSSPWDVSTKSGEVSTSLSDYSGGGLRGMEFVPGIEDKFWTCGAGTDVEMKEYSLP